MNKAKKRTRVKTVKEREKRETEYAKLRNSATLITLIVTMLGMLLFILTILVISNTPADRRDAAVGVTQRIVQDGIFVFLHSLRKASVQTTYACVTIENAVVAAFLLNVGMGIVARSAKK